MVSYFLLFEHNSAILQESSLTSKSTCCSCSDILDRTHFNFSFPRTVCLIVVLYLTSTISFKANNTFTKWAFLFIAPEKYLNRSLEGQLIDLLTFKITFISPLYLRRTFYDNQLIKHVCTILLKAITVNNDARRMRSEMCICSDSIKWLV